MKEGWVYKKLKEIGKTQTGSTPSKSNDAYYGRYMPFIRPAELNFNNIGEINYNSEIKLSELGVNCSRVIDENSTLMCCIGSIGKIGFATQKVTCNQQINAITPNKDYNARFIYYALLSPEFQEEVIKIANSARATLAIISKGKWENISIPIPPLFEQQRIVSYLDAEFAKIEALKANAEKQLSEARTLPAEQVSPLEKMGYQELMRLVEALPADARTVFNMYVLEGYSHKEIAVRLGCTEATSRSKLQRARVRLQEMIKEAK